MMLDYVVERCFLRPSAPVDTGRREPGARPVGPLRRWSVNGTSPSVGGPVRMSERHPGRSPPVSGAGIAPWDRSG